MASEMRFLLNQRTRQPLLWTGSQLSSESYTKHTKRYGALTVCPVFAIQLDFLDKYALPRPNQLHTQGIVVSPARGGAAEADLGGTLHPAHRKSVWFIHKEPLCPQRHLMRGHKVTLSNLNKQAPSCRQLNISVRSTHAPYTDTLHTVTAKRNLSAYVKWYGQISFISKK